MRFKTCNSFLPYIISNKLFGDRKQFGTECKEDDACWKEWQKTYHDFYQSTQKKGVGSLVNNAGYHVLKKIDLDGLNVLEIGPGGLFHIDYWCGKPKNYKILDIDESFLNTAASKIEKHQVSCDKLISKRATTGEIPLEDASCDLILSFYCFEHLYPFTLHLDEMIRVLKPKGRIAGAIPCEGGIGWGLGRYFTSRRWLLKNTSINPDKIICWEHPTMAVEILNTMNEKMIQIEVDFWPVKIPLIDINLVTKFIYQKP